jgi:phosphatidate cytidylyltransferase
MDLVNGATPLAVYTIATAIVLVGVSVLLAIVRVPGVWVPIRTWLVMLPIALGALWLGPPAWTVLVTVVSILGFKEYARATGLYRELPFVVVVYVTIIAANLAALLQRYDFFMAIPMWGVLLLVIVPILRNRTEDMLQWFALAVVGLLLFGFFLAPELPRAVAVGPRIRPLRGPGDPIQRRDGLHLRPAIRASSMDRDQSEQDR